MRMPRLLASGAGLVMLIVVLGGCVESKVALNLINSDNTGQCWSEWYTIPASQAETDVSARQYIADKKIKPFDVTAVSC